MTASPRHSRTIVPNLILPKPIVPNPVVLRPSSLSPIGTNPLRGNRLLRRASVRSSTRLLPRLPSPRLLLRLRSPRLLRRNRKRSRRHPRRKNGSRNSRNLPASSGSTARVWTDLFMHPEFSQGAFLQAPTCAIAEVQRSAIGVSGAGCSAYCSVWLDGSEPGLPLML